MDDDTNQQQAQEEPVYSTDYSQPFFERKSVSLLSFLSALILVIAGVIEIFIGTSSLYIEVGIVVIVLGIVLLVRNILMMRGISIGSILNKGAQ